MATIKISDEELNSINRAMLMRHGIDFTRYESGSLKRRVARVIEKYRMGDVIALWRKILSDKEFIKEYVDELTVGLTEMFRNPEFWQKLEKEILPQLPRQDRWKIWHAGCSTGEEVYSMAILLDQNQWLDKTNLHATDLSSKAVAAAEQGAYDLDLMKKYRSNFAEYSGGKALSDYFADNHKLSHADRRLVKNCTFLQHNLTKDDYPAGFDLIFCRNVMIYFDEDLKRSILEDFYKALAPGGFLIIGYYDALPSGYDKYFRSIDYGAKIFERQG